MGIEKEKKWIVESVGRLILCGSPSGLVESAFSQIGAYFREIVSIISCLVIEKSEEKTRKMMAWDFLKMVRGREWGD